MADTADINNSVPPVSASTLGKDLKDIWSKTGTLATVVTFPSMSLTAVIAQLLEPYRSLGEIIVLTAPLVCSATILAMMVMRGSFKGTTDNEKVWTVAGIIIIPYVIAFFLGAATKIGDQYTTVERWSDYNPVFMFLKFAVGILVYYFSSYGFMRTLTSVLCGCFIAWVFEKKLLPRVRRLEVRS